MLVQAMTNPHVAISGALRAVRTAREAAYSDTRTSSSACTEYLDAAERSIEQAVAFMVELRRAERTAEREPSPAPQRARQAVFARIGWTSCHVCGERLESGDVAVCGGCDHACCPDCMDEEFCVECVGEEA